MGSRNRAGSEADSVGSRNGAGSEADSVGSWSGLWSGLCGLTERSGLWSGLCGLTERALEQNLWAHGAGPGADSVSSRNRSGSATNSTMKAVPLRLRARFM